jgi:hypothetical protein
LLRAPPRSARPEECRSVAQATQSSRQLLLAAVDTASAGFTELLGASKSLPLPGVRQRARASGKALAFKCGVLRLSAIDQLVEVR